jgi:hypothetical protein
MITKSDFPGKGAAIAFQVFAIEACRTGQKQGDNGWYD